MVAMSRWIEATDGEIDRLVYELYGLTCGDIGTVVLLHGEEGYEVEFVALDGETLVVGSLAPWWSTSHVNRDGHL